MQGVEVPSDKIQEKDEKARMIEEIAEVPKIDRLASNEIQKQIAKAAASAASALPQWPHPPGGRPAPNRYQSTHLGLEKVLKISGHWGGYCT